MQQSSLTQTLTATGKAKGPYRTPATNNNAAAAEALSPTSATHQLINDPRVRPAAGALDITQQLSRTLKRTIPSAHVKHTTTIAKPLHNATNTTLQRPKYPTIAEMHTKITVQKKRQALDLTPYLEDQTAPTPTVDIDSQTDAFMPEAPERQYIPAKAGAVDQGSQVEIADVYNYDRDVEVLLQVLCSKITEQALQEVIEEEELHAIELERQRLTEKHRQEAEVIAERERAAVAAHKHKHQLLESARAKRAAEVQLVHRIQAQRLATQMLQHLHTDSVQQLVQQQYFSDAHRLAADQTMTAVLSDVKARVVEQFSVSQQSADHLVQQSVQAINEEVQRLNALHLAQQQHSDQLYNAQVAAHQLEQQRTLPIELFIHLQASAPVSLAQHSPVGPFHLTGNTTVTQLKQCVVDWMNDVLTEEQKMELTTVRGEQQPKPAAEEDDEEEQDAETDNTEPKITPISELVDLYINDTIIATDGNSVQTLFDLQLSNLSQIQLVIRQPTRSAESKPGGVT